MNCFSYKTGIEKKVTPRSDVGNPNAYFEEPSGYYDSHVPRFERQRGVRQDDDNA